MIDSPIPVPPQLGAPGLSASKLLAPRRTLTMLDGCSSSTLRGVTQSQPVQLLSLVSLA